MTITHPSLAWYLHRLRAMGAAEIFGRLREKLRHTTERLALSTVDGVRLEGAARPVPLVPAAGAAPGFLKQALADDAARISAGRWNLFGWREVALSPPPDWHRDGVSGVEVPVTGRKPDHRSLSGGADVRVIWEINRWAEMVRLAMHAHVNGDPGSLETAQDWLEDWVEKNPPGRGVNWTSALEAGLRLVNFCWFDALVAASGGGKGGNEPVDAGSASGSGGWRRIRARQARLADAIVPRHVWWVRRYLSFGSSANNHRLGELTGLLLAVRRWPELERIGGRAEWLWSQVAECVLGQFAGDGGNREQALHYHLFALEMALQAVRAMGVRTGAVAERLGRAVEFFARMAQAREPWDFGDSDDAQVVPLAARRGSALAEWSDWMRGEPGGGALAFWLPGLERVVGSRIARRADIDADWWLAPQSGQAVCRRDGWTVRLDASPLGFGRLAAHGHCDALHVSVWDGHEALLIDPGTGSYFTGAELRSELASWTAHNGPQPREGFQTPRRLGTFLWSQHHPTPVLQRMGEGVKASLRHEGHALARRVTVEDGVVTIEDREEEDLGMRVRWMLAPECRLQAIDGSPGAWWVRRGERRWRLEVAAGRGRVVQRGGRASPAFGRCLETPVIEVEGCGPLCLSLRRG